MAESKIDAGLYGEALAELERSLGITGDSHESTRALYLKGRGLIELGRFDEAVEALNRGLSISYRSASAQVSLSLLRDTNTERDVHLDLEDFDRIIKLNPQDAVAYYLRGRAHLILGNPENAVLNLDESYSLGLKVGEVRADRAYAHLKNGDPEFASGEMKETLDDAPQNPLFNAYLGEIYMAQGAYAEALNLLENANVLDPDLGLAYLIRGKLYMSWGLQESAEEVFDSSVGLDLPTAQDYVDRGEIRAFFGEYDLAFSDFNEAIRINPNQAKFYNARAKAYATMSDFEAALADFNTGIGIGPPTSEFFINRGIVYHLLGDSDSSLADFELATSLGEVDVPLPNDRDPSYFAVYSDTTSADDQVRLGLDLLTERQALRDIQFFAVMDPNDSAYQDALQIIGPAYLYLEMWEEAADSLSLLVDLSSTNAEVYRNRGHAYLALERYEAANSDYQLAVDLDPLNSENFIARGNGYAGIGEYALARDDYTEAIHMDPNSSGAYKFRGFLSVQGGTHSMAFSDINIAIGISPLDHDAYFKRASAYIGLGQSSRALVDLDQAINLAPTNSDYLYSRGLLHLELEEYDLALNDFDAAIRLKQGYAYVDPRHARPLVDRGKEYLRLGNPSHALVDGQRAIELLENKFDSSEWDNRRPVINLQIADAHQLLGDALDNLGRIEEARTHYDLASEIRQSHSP